MNTDRLRQDLPTDPKPDELSPILVAGATGYVGDRLVPRLLSRGYRVRAMSRSSNKLNDRHWSDHPRLETIAADALNEEELIEAADGCQTAFYLIHSLYTAGKEFEDADRRAAENMVAAANKANLKRLIYLGGLGRPGDDLSPHLASRAEVAGIFQRSEVTTTILRAGIIIGSGSASFEILRYLVERLPVMITPRWVRTKTQPIGIRNVLSYLIGVLESPEAENESYDIGGQDVLTYQELLQLYAERAGLPRRWVIPVPVLSPTLSSGWVHLVTPVPGAVARPLIEGLRNPAVCQESTIQDLIPVKIQSADRAIELALKRINEGQVESHWSDAGSLPAEASQPGDPDWAGGTILRDCREIIVDNEPECLWDTIVGVGGKSGWFGIDVLWKIRGWMDRLIGGVGHTRGRRDPQELQIGDALDFWRVLDMDRPHRLTLLAEMKIPGTATLSFELEPLGEDQLVCRQTARFEPSGLLGLVYWYGIFPIHSLVFTGMLKEIASQSNVNIHQKPTKIEA